MHQMGDYMQRGSFATACFVAVVVGTLLTGCADTSATRATGPTTTATPTPTPTVVSFDMPSDLGPAPASDALSDEQIEALRVQNQEQNWQDVLKRFPDAVRPDVTFAGYLTPADDIVAVMTPCYTAFNIELEHGSTVDGKVVSVGPANLDEQGEIASYVCRSTHPSKPIAPMNTAQKEWLYRYLTEFLAPCFAANGIENPPAPSRTDFVAQWPNQGWWPTSGNAPMGTDQDLALQRACPGPE
ncbi:hypothetical protein WJX64_00445 [Leifsonia sp. YIM 134122]|uniref:Lipoprotein n=1 Tax=Leifsonia stereocauli TaxID=3134136 RepID=A0ABU9VZ62_9MICO